MNTLANEASENRSRGTATWCALLTPPGRGAIATIGVRGMGAVAAVASCFQPASGKPLGSVPLGRVIFGRFQSLSGVCEELVVGMVSAEEVEVHCHGGMAAAQAILAALVAAGCRAESWREWAVAEQRDSIAATALIALADARTERTAAILLDQNQGALRRELEQIGVLIRVDSHQALNQLQLLLSRSNLGQHLTRPWRVVLTGAPNVGKSSLINALLGYQRAIVAGRPGTTRDVLTATTAIEGWPVELADTAGRRDGGDAIEVEGIARALRQIAEAELVLEVVDVTAMKDRRQGTGVGLMHHATLATPAPTLVILNKCDVRPPAHGAAGIAVSARTGQGIEELIRAIARELVPSRPPRGAAVPFTEVQISALRHALTALDRGEPDAARQAIESLR